MYRQTTSFWTLFFLKFFSLLQSFLYTEKSLGECQHRRRASSANVTLVPQRAHFGLATRRLWARSAPIMLALEVCATACHTGGLRARTERAVRLTFESAVFSSIGYPGGLHRIAVRPTTFPCMRKQYNVLKDLKIMVNCYLFRNIHIKVIANLLIMLQCAINQYSSFFYSDIAPVRYFNGPFKSYHSENLLWFSKCTCTSLSRYLISMLDHHHSSRIELNSAALRTALILKILLYSDMILHQLQPDSLFSRLRKIVTRD